MTLKQIKKAAIINEQFFKFKNYMKDRIIQVVLDVKNEDYWRCFINDQDENDCEIKFGGCEKMINFADEYKEVGDDLLRLIFYEYNLSGFLTFKDIAFYDWGQQILTRFIYEIMHKFQPLAKEHLKNQDDIAEYKYDNQNQHNNAKKELETTSINQLEGLKNMNIKYKAINFLAKLELHEFYFDYGW